MQPRPRKPRRLTGEAEAVAVGVLEPCGPARAGDVQVALEDGERHVGMLEAHALGLQRPHRRLDVVADVPGDGGRLVGAGMLGLVDVARRITAREGDQPVATGLDRCRRRRRPGRALVEPARGVWVPDRDVRDRVDLAQQVAVPVAAGRGPRRDGARSSTGIVVPVPKRKRNGAVSAPWRHGRGGKSGRRNPGPRPPAAAPYSRSDTTMSRLATLASAVALQLVMRMQPLDSLLPILAGDGVPWMP